MNHPLLKILVLALLSFAACTKKDAGAPNMVVQPDPNGDGGGTGEPIGGDDGACAAQAPVETPKGLLGNAMIAANGTLRPLYTVTGDANVKQVSYRYYGTDLTAETATCRELWTKSHVLGAPFGGFDFDGDGYPDLYYIHMEATAEKCATKTIQQSAIDFVSGRDGKLYQNVVGPTPDKCIPTANDNKGVVYTQWNHRSVIFGAAGKRFAIEPYVPPDGIDDTIPGTFLFELQPAISKIASVLEYVFPSYPRYDSTYSNAAFTKWSPTGPNKYKIHSHQGQGLIVEYQGSRRLLLFTSGRVVQYDVLNTLAGNASMAKLVQDTPYLSNNNTSLNGYNYGLVATDPGDARKVVLLGGTSNYSLFYDTVNGKQGYDVGGLTERHITLYDFVQNQLSDVAFRVTDDPYYNRIVYPNQPFIRMPPVGGQAVPSRVAYNVYNLNGNGRWEVHITAPGNVQSELPTVLTDMYLWDVRDVDGDGIDELFISPTSGYYARFETQIYHWKATTPPPANDPSGGTLERDTTYDLSAGGGGIPYLASFHREPGRYAMYGYVYPVATVVQNGILKLVLMKSDKTLSTVPLTGAGQ